MLIIVEETKVRTTCGSGWFKNEGHIHSDKEMFTVRKDIPPLNAKQVQPDLENLLIAIPNLIDRDWPPAYSTIPDGQILFYTRLSLVRNTYETLMWLLVESTQDPRRDNLFISASPLVRTLFEELIALIFIFHDLPSLNEAFRLTGYNEVIRQRNHALKYHKNDPKWESEIARLDNWVVKLENTMPVPPALIGKSTNYWPTPGSTLKEIKKKYPNSSSRDFVEYLNSWMYRSLSADSHLSYQGLIRRGSFFAGKELRKHFGEEKARENLKKTREAYRMEMIWTTFTLLLAICSEVEFHFSFGRLGKILWLWESFVGTSDLSREFYDRRYKVILNGREVPPLIGFSK